MHEEPEVPNYGRPGCGPLLRSGMCICIEPVSYTHLDVYKRQGLGMAAADKKIIDIAISELSAITGQKAVATVSKKE